MTEVDERAKDVLNTPMPVDENGAPTNEAGAATVREFLTGVLAELWRDPPKRVWGTSDWDGPLEKALITAGLVEGTFDEDGYIEDSDDRAFRALVADAINMLAEVPAPPELPPLDYQVDVLSSLLAHLRMRLEWIERGASYEFDDVNAKFSPAQVWGRLLRNTAEQRLAWIEGVVGQAEAAGRCWMVQHDRVIEEQRERIVALEERLTDLGGELP